MHRYVLISCLCTNEYTRYHYAYIYVPMYIYIYMYSLYVCTPLYMQMHSEAP